MSMDRINSICLLVFFALLITTAVVSEAKRVRGVKKLFVFGDSYADTGNLGKLGRVLTHNWFDPYGMTFPGKPSGRFSDGRILTDYIAMLLLGVCMTASFLGIKSPTPYKYRKEGPNPLRHGMNFAVGGAGVYDTGNFQKNLAAQIDTFEEMINAGIFSGNDIRTSAAFVCIAGNDYDHYVHTNPSYQNLSSFVKNVTTQLVLDLKRIHNLGLEKLVVTNMHPLQCTPYITKKYDYTRCEDGGIIQMGVTQHNMYMVREIATVFGQNMNKTLLTLDLHSVFLSALQQKGVKVTGKVLKPCCEGVGEDSYCGMLDENGNKQYTLCRDPESSFYWDSVHLSQAGWAAAFEKLKPSFKRFFHS